MKRKHKDLRNPLIAASFVAGVGLLSLLFGAAGIEKPVSVHEFNYHGKKARIMKEDVKYSPIDKYYLSMEGKGDRLVGQFTSDKGIIFYVGPNNWSARVGGNK